MQKALTIITIFINIIIITLFFILLHDLNIEKQKFIALQKTMIKQEDKTDLLQEIAPLENEYAKLKDLFKETNLYDDIINNDAKYYNKNCQTKRQQSNPVCKRTLAEYQQSFIILEYLTEKYNNILLSFDWYNFWELSIQKKRMFKTPNLPARPEKMKTFKSILKDKTETELETYIFYIKSQQAFYDTFL